MNRTGRQEDWDRLCALSAQWDAALAGRLLHRAVAGEGWVRLLVAGDDRLSLLLVNRPGCRLGLLESGRLPEPIHAALKPRKDHPLGSLLSDCTLTACRVLADDRVVVLQLTGPDGKPLALMQQQYGARGNLALVGTGDRLLWAQHRPPTDRLTHLPRRSDLANPLAEVPDPDGDESAPDMLALHLADDLERRLGGGLRRRLQSAQRLADNLARDLAVADRGEEFRRKAEALAAHLHELVSGQDKLDVPDLRHGTPLHIDLDPALSASANLSRWFKRAGKAEKGREVIRIRLLDAETERDEAAALQREVDACAGEPLAKLAALQDLAQRHPDLLPDRSRRPGRGRSPYGPEQPARRFRRYLIDDRWEVWVGRDNRENDELTHRASHTRDIWLHAQGVSGSHVILRTEGKPDQVPRGVLARAASLAALHSKARHAGLVPVIWTERRYVRKPRKAAPGLAVCLRENSLMVEPGIADGVVTN
ncbi:DUF814 domain-containing protein [bacterium]|nr:DUF814 domain-containing protein [bacterium]PIV80726.1 MAG: hypothetical protein COW53_08160 [bacterium CG17_big_fil_post_rev_8_21_14_2_50_64_8]PJA73544.1 MAG: hypothetical protein CO151_13015 [bacterium CG_4_9_14_3_um_filter_65_15]